MPVIAAALSVLSIGMIFFGLQRLLASDVDISSRLGYYDAPKRHRSSQRGSSSALTTKMDKAMAGYDFASDIQRELARANLKLTVAEYLTICGASVLGLAAVAMILSHNAAGTLVGAIVGFYLPRLYVRHRQNARLKAFSDQLADTIMLVANSLRSGYSLLQGLELVSREASQPSAEEFGRVVKEVNLGLTPEEALEHLVRRIQSDDLDLLASAINVQHEVGGNLSEILESIAATIRERVRIKGEIKSLTSQQTLSGYVISLLPVVIGFLLFMINSKYMMQLFSTETIICFPVIAMPICAGVLLIIGFFTMKKITDIEV